MLGLISGAEQRLTAYCPNCRTTGMHKMIEVSDTIALLWCERCRVPRIREADDEAHEPPTEREAAPGGSAGPRLIYVDGMKVEVDTPP